MQKQTEKQKYDLQYNIQLKFTIFFIISYVNITTRIIKTKPALNILITCLNKLIAQQLKSNKMVIKKFLYAVNYDNYTFNSGKIQCIQTYKVNIIFLGKIVGIFTYANVVQLKL